MAPLKAHVRNGQLSEVDLLPIDGWDELDESDRRLLHEALAASDDDLAAGRARPAEEILAELRRTR